MKYIKKYNEDIDWDWVDEDENSISNKFDKIDEKILKNDYPIIIKIHKDYHDELVKLLYKRSINIDILKRNRIISEYNKTGFLYFYIKKLLSIRDEFYITYNEDLKSTIEYNKNKYPNIEIIEIV